MARPALWNARLRSDGERTRAGSRSGRGFTPAKWSSCPAVFEGLPSTSPAASPRWLKGGELFVSSTTRELVAGSSLGFTSRGRHVLKGVAGEREVFALDR